jgi:hypothetical protein
LGLAREVRAQDRSVLLVGKNVPEIFERIRGQTADLNWSLKVNKNIEVGNATQAREAGERSGVSVVIWFEVFVKNAIAVNVFDLASSRLFQRRVEPTNQRTALSASATVEAAALVVRSVLIALTEGESGHVSASVKGGTGNRPEIPSRSKAPSQSSVAVAPSTRVAQQTPVSQAQASNRSVEEVNADQEPSRTEPQPEVQQPVEAVSTEGNLPAVSVAGAETAWQLAAGWQVAIDGASPLGQQGPSVRIGLDINHWLLALSGQITLPAELQERELSIELYRYGFIASGGYEVLANPALRLYTVFALGFLVVSRSTDVHVKTLEPTDDSSVTSLILQGDARFQWFPSWFDRVIGLEFALGLALLPATPIFSVEEANSKEFTLKKSWIVQPTVCISLVLHTV